MTIWTPDIEPYGSPKYIAIVEALATDVRTGRLPSGNRLPPQRELADRLGVTVGTITRAYAEAEKRNLVTAHVGRGTFIRAEPGAPVAMAGPAGPYLIDLSVNRMPMDLDPELYANGLRNLAESGSLLNRWVDYQNIAGMAAHREVAAKFIAGFGVPVQPDDVLITAGAQHAMAVAMLGLTEPGDTVLTGHLSYPGIVSLAQVMGRHLEGVALDEEGLLPDALDAACRAYRPRVLYCLPNLQNPTTGTMSLARRQAIVEVARKHDLLLLEDDLYGYLLPDAPLPLTHLAPERGYYITGVSKFLGAGLRVGFLRTPPGQSDRFVPALRSTLWSNSPVMVELVSRWLQDGTANRVAGLQRREAQVRQSLAMEVLEGLPMQTNANSCHLWLHLPPPWRGDDLVLQAKMRGVALNGPQPFVAGRGPTPDAVRVSLGAAQPRERLEAGLQIVADLLHAGPQAAPPIV